MYKGDVAKLANRNKDRAAKDASAEWKAVIILVPMRLGGESFNPAYMDCIKVTVQGGAVNARFWHSRQHLGTSRLQSVLLLMRHSGDAFYPCEAE